MAAALTLFCLAIDNQKAFIGDVFDVEIQANSLVSRLKDAIKVKMTPRLDNLAANELILWKLSTPLSIDPETSTISTVKKTIRDIDLPSAEDDKAGLGNGTVQALYPTKRLSNYWNNIPNEDHLHLVIQVPFNNPENLLEDLPGDSPKPPYADLITFTVPSAQRFLSLKRIDFYTREVEVATGQSPSYIHDFLGSLNRQRVISPNATGSSMLREHLGDFFDTYFREGTNSEDPATVTNSEIGLYSHVLSSSEILATGNFGFEKEGHTGAAFLFDVAGEFRRLAGEIGNAEFRTTWSFPLLAAPQNQPGIRRRYGPRSDFRLVLRGFPHCIMEVSSHEGGRSNDQPDQNRMILQGSCLARLANALRMKVFEKEPIVISAIFIDRKLVAHEYLMYQPNLGDNKVLYHEKTFDLSKPKQAFEFIFRLYNLISRAINDNGKLDDDLLTELINLKDKFPYTQYPALTTDQMSNNKKKNPNPSASNDGASGSRKRPRTEGGNTQKRGDVLEGRPVQESLEDAGYMITQQEDDRVVAQLTSRMRTARSRDGAPVVLKLLDDDTDELKILQYLSRFKLPSNHAIELHGLVDLTIGRVIALPCRTPLDVYFRSWYPGRSTVSLQTQLLEGVAFLHEHKIAHLDLKPGNVVVDSKSDRYCPRLSIIDFGLSVLVEDEETMIEGYRGTRTWTAPEVGTSDDPDTKYNPILADRWACGRMIDYLEDHDLEGDNSWGVLRKLCEALLADNPRSRPSVSEVLEKYGLYERDRVVKRRAGEDEMDVLRKRIRVNCAEDIVNINGPTLKMEMDDGMNGNWIACS